MNQGLKHLNSLPPDDAERELLKCCGSKHWARRVTSQRPFKDVSDLLRNADHTWWSLAPDDWLEAFRSHPKIGENKSASSHDKQSHRWAEQEQAGTRDAVQETRQELARLNQQYEQNFGFIFIVCATGKSSEEMLSILRERLSNTREEELRNAAVEQAKITELRINKLLNQ